MADRDDAGVAGGRARADVVLLDQRDVVAAPRQVVRAADADDAAADDDGVTWSRASFFAFGTQRTVNSVYGEKRSPAPFRRDQLRPAAAFS